MEKYLSIAEMRSVEREANESGLSYANMMENAGTNLARWINHEYHHCSPRSVLALVGSGNNGGDALVALCRLIELGWHTIAAVVHQRKEDDPLIQRYSRMGGSIYIIDDDAPDTIMGRLFQRISLVIDGVLGTGVRLPLPDSTARILGCAKQLVANSNCKIHVVAVDCPSGINCDSGVAAAETIPAEVTYTMAAIKPGLLKFPAANVVGTLRVGSIGQVAKLAAWTRITRGVIADDDIFPYLPPRARDAHKGTFGTALIIAGSGSYPGAMLLAGEAAYRIGCGLVTIAIPELIFSAVAGILKEATWVRLSHEDGWIDKDAIDRISGIMPRASALLVGPGLGIDATTGAFIKELIQHTLPPCVLDADSLKLLAQVPGWDTLVPGMAVLTPHPGEMAVLTGLPKEEIQANRIEVAEEYSRKWKKVVVLKGAYTVISEPSGKSMIVPVATSALARAGTGDILAGLIVGLLAQGLDPFRAAYISSYVHALAGLASEEYLGTSASVLASDVLRTIPKVISKYR